MEDLVAARASMAAAAIMAVFTIAAHKRATCSSYVPTGEQGHIVLLRALELRMEYESQVHQGTYPSEVVAD